MACGIFSCTCGDIKYRHMFILDFRGELAERFSCVVAVVLLVVDIVIVVVV